MPPLSHLPEFTPEAAAALARELYGLAAAAAPLPGERDRNFLLAGADGERRVLKIAPADADEALLAAQHQALALLAERGGRCPRVLPTLAGETLPRVTAADGETHLAWLMTHLPGRPLAEARPHGPELLADLGRCLGETDRALAGFDHPALHRDFPWDLAQGLEVVRQRVHLVADADLRALIERLAAGFERDTALRLPRLRRGVIHNDANDYNVLVEGGARGQRVSGLVDFGDLAHTYLVAEPAIAVAYAVLDRPDPLAAAVSLTQGYHAVQPLEEDEFAALWDLARLRLCVSACIAAAQQPERPDDPYLGISQEPLRRALPRLAEIDPRLATAVLRAACGAAPRPDPELLLAFAPEKPPRAPAKEETLAARRRLLGANLSVAYRDPVKLVRGRAQYLWDETGRRYLDAYNNVPHVGHCHPRVVAAGQRQMGLLNTNTRYLHDLLNEYAERLAATLPEPLSVCFFLNSASEANELALRLARAATGKRDMIVLEAAYHGHTTSLIDLSPYKHAGPGGEGAPGWVHVAPVPDLYRGPYRADDPQAGEQYAAHAAELIARLQAAGRGLCGFLAETWPSVGGQLVPPDGYLAAVYRAVRAAGGVCIADEVQTGYGRTGAHFSAFEGQGVVPDIVVLGKPIGNGHPLGAVVTTPEIAAAFANGMEFFSTFGGNTVSCAIGLAVLEVLEEERLQAHALRVGERLLAALRGLKEQFPIIGDVRGSGLFLGVELVRDRETLEPAGEEAGLVADRLRERGILLGTDGPFHNVLKIRPPMPFSEADAEVLVAALDEALAAGFGE